MCGQLCFLTPLTACVDLSLIRRCRDGLQSASCPFCVSITGSVGARCSRVNHPQIPRKITHTSDTRKSTASHLPWRCWRQSDSSTSRPSLHGIHPSLFLHNSLATGTSGKTNLQLFRVAQHIPILRSDLLLTTSSCRRRICKTPTYISTTLARLNVVSVHSNTLILTHQYTLRHSLSFYFPATASYLAWCEFQPDLDHSVVKPQRLFLLTGCSAITQST